MTATPGKMSAPLLLRPGDEGLDDGLAFALDDVIRPRGSKHVDAGIGEDNAAFLQPLYGGARFVDDGANQPGIRFPVAVVHDVLERFVTREVDEAFALHDAIGGKGAMQEVGRAPQGALLLEDDYPGTALRGGDRGGHACRPGADYDYIGFHRYLTHS